MAPILESSRHVGFFCISDEITDLNIQIPRGAQINHPTVLIVNVLNLNHSSHFGLVHYVWNFGDKVT